MPTEADLDAMIADTERPSSHAALSDALTEYLYSHPALLLDPEFEATLRAHHATRPRAIQPFEEWLAAARSGSVAQAKMLPMLHMVNVHNLCGVERLTALTVTERLRLLDRLQATERGLFSGATDEPMLRLAVMGALSLLSAHGNAEVPEEAYRVLGHMIGISYGSPASDSDPGERA